MERRYLVASLALVATFALVSPGMKCGLLAHVPHSRAELAANIACARHYVVQKIVAQLDPQAETNAPEQAQIVAELNLPDVAALQQKADEAQQFVQEKVARQRCEAAQRARGAQQQAYRMQVLTSDQLRQLNDLANVQVFDLSQQTGHRNKFANQRALEINVREIEHAQRLAVRAMEKAQRNIERSRMNLVLRQPSPTAMHINFVTPAVPAVPAVPALAPAPLTIEIPSAMIQ